MTQSDHFNEKGGQQATDDHKNATAMMLAIQAEQEKLLRHLSPESNNAGIPPSQ